MAQGGRRNIRRKPRDFRKRIRLRAYCLRASDTCPTELGGAPTASSHAQTRAGTLAGKGIRPLDLLPDSGGSPFSPWRCCEEAILDAERETRVLQGSYLEKQRAALDALRAFSVLGAPVWGDGERFACLARRLFGMVLYSRTPLHAGDVDSIVRLLLDSDLSLLRKAEFAVLRLLLRSAFRSIPRKAFDQVRAALESRAGEADAFPLLLIGIVYCRTGEYKKVIDVYDKYSAKQYDCPFFHEMFCMEVSIAALYTREYHTCYGITESFRNTAELTGSSYLSARWKIHLVFLLLHLRKFDEALLHLDQLLSLSGIDERYTAVGMIQRALALYHFMNGRAVAAARVLAAHTGNLLAKGVLRPEFSDPLVLGMLCSLKRNHRLTVPGYDLDRELDRAETGPDRLLKGVALRLRGQILLDSGEIEGALALFRESFRNLLLTGDCEETMQCGLELAVLLKDAGNRAEERQVKERLAVVAASPQQRRPEGSDGPETYGKASSSVRGCIAQLALIPRTSGFSEGMAHLLGVIQRSLSAQRAVLLRPAAGARAYEPAGSSNLTPVELRESPLRKTIEALKMGCLRATPGRNLIHHDEGSALGCALFVDSGRPWCLYMDNTLEGSSLVDLPPQAVELISDVIAAEIRGLLAREKADGKPAASSRDDTTSGPLYWGEGMRDVLEEAVSLAESNVSVLIYGETGVGKERLARYIHERSRCCGPFVAVNLACVPEHLFESELFGHEKGAFTGAVRSKQGLVELAQNGTLFLDEIGDIPLPFQIKLLRFLEEREFLRMGGLQTFSPKFRLLTATNKNLRQEVALGRFREDLYYRIAVAALEIPPLRARGRDIIPLAKTLYAHYAASHGRRNCLPAGQDLELLVNHSWPGNVRELKNVVERAAALQKPCRIDCSRPFEEAPSPAFTEGPAPFAAGDSGLSLEEVQFAHIRQVLRMTGGKVHGPGGALAILKMKKTTFYSRLKAMNGRRTH